MFVPLVMINLDGNKLNYHNYTQVRKEYKNIIQLWTPKKLLWIRRHTGQWKSKLNTSF